MMFTKVSGVLLATLLVVLGLKEVAHVVYHPHELEEDAYVIEVPEDLGAAAPEEEAPLDLGRLLPMASVEAGKTASAKCMACHTFEAGGPVVTGPNLHDVLGREAGSVAGFNYSSAMADYDNVWTYENLNAFLADPRGYLPGTAMVFVGLPKDEERLALIAYLRDISPNPPPLPDPLPEPEPEADSGDDAAAVDAEEADAGADAE